MGEGVLAVSETNLPAWLPHRLLTVVEVAEVLRLSQRQVWRLIADGRLPASRVGRRVLIKPESVVALLENDVIRTKMMSRNRSS
jgi:excisionase family DNA binding protein